jgi:hypothetical protein
LQPRGFSPNAQACLPPPADFEVFTESVIRAMTRLSNQHGAINLSQGFPDFDPPEELLAALERATRGPFHQYAVTWGAPRFRQALARKSRISPVWRSIPIKTSSSPAAARRP